MFWFSRSCITAAGRAIGDTGSRNKLKFLLSTSFAIALLGISVGGCTLTTTPGGKVQTQWAGTYAKQQAAEQDEDRATALAVRKAVGNDPVLAPLGLSVFVEHGNVRLCGNYPDQAARDRAVGLLQTLPEVVSVDTHCNR